MFNKELLMNTGGQQPVALTVGRYTVNNSYHRYGYGLYYGWLAPRPFWGKSMYINELKHDDEDNRTSCLMTEKGDDITVYVSGYQDSPIRSWRSISGDPFEFKVKDGQTVYLTFDPPPDGYLDPVTDKPL